MIRKIGDWQVDPDTSTLQRGRLRRHVTPRSMDVLIYLADHPHETIKGETLLDQFWSNPQVGAHAVHKVISELRHALNDDPKHQKYIRTIHKRGYQLVAEILGDLTTLESDDRSGTESHANGHGVSTDKSKISLGVLKFEGFPASPESELLAAEIAEALINGMAQVPFFTLAAKREAFRISGNGMSISEIGSTLGVDHILDGGIHVQENRLRFTVELERVSDGCVLYTEQFDVDFPLALAIQDTIVARVVSAVNVHLDVAQRQQMLDWGTTNVEAYLLALDSNFKSHQDSSEDLRGALEGYQKAIQLDPGFKAAYEGAVETAHSLMVYATPAEFRKLGDLSRSIAKEAKRQRIDSAEIRIRMARTVRNGHLSAMEHELFGQIRGGSKGLHLYYEYGRILMGGRLFRTAVRFMEREVEYHPEMEPEVFKESTNCYVHFLGLEESVARHKIALQERPDHVGQMFPCATELARLGRFSEAEDVLDHIEKVDEEGIWAYSARREVMIMKGELPLGSEAFEEALLNESLSRYGRAVFCFLHGDVSRGVDFWRQLVTRDLMVASYYLPKTEVLFPSEVADDPYYKQGLSEIGIGQEWTAYLRKRVHVLQEHTDIRLSDL